MVKKSVTFACVVTMMYGVSACSKQSESIILQQDEKDRYVPIKTFPNQPFLGEITLEDYDFDAGLKYLATNYTDLGTGGCSSCRVGDYHGRNLDWYLYDQGLLVVHLQAKEGRYASLGVSSGNSIVPRSTISSGKLYYHSTYEGKDIDDLFSVITTHVTAGINECGVCVNDNVVIKENDGSREGYIPVSGNREERPIFFSALPRYVLDNCSSVDDAIEKLKKLNVVGATKGAFEDEDCILLVSDPQKSIAVEWYNNQFRYTEFTKENNFKSSNGLNCVLTNYYVHVLEEKTLNGQIDTATFFEAHPYAMGVERGLYLNQQIANGRGKTLKDMENLMQEVFYSNYYNESIGWTTESPKEFYFRIASNSYAYTASFINQEELIPCNTLQEARDSSFYGNAGKEERELFGSLKQQIDPLYYSGNDSDFWYTQYSLVFDIPNHCFYLLPQEGYFNKEWIKFEL